MKLAASHEIGRTDTVASRHPSAILAAIFQEDGTGPYPILDALAALIAEGDSTPSFDAVIKRSGVKVPAGMNAAEVDTTPLMGRLALMLIGEIAESVKIAEQADPMPVGRSVRAYLDAARAMYHGSNRLFASMLSVALVQEDVQEAWAVHTSRWRMDDQFDGVDPVNALICRLALDGLRLNRLLNSLDLDEAHRTQLFDRLEELTQSERGLDAFAGMGRSIR
jgi:hypothetical protein